MHDFEAKNEIDFIRRSLSDRAMITKMGVATRVAPADAKPLDKVIKKLQDALQKYQDSLGSGKDALPPLESVELDFKVTTATTLGGTINVFIFRFDVSHEDDVVNDVTYTYSVPPAKKMLGKPPPLDDALASTIQSAAKAVKTAPTLGQLKFDKLEVTVQYGVQWNVGGGANAPIQFVTIGLSADKHKNTVQSVKITFHEPEKPKKRKL